METLVKATQTADRIGTAAHQTVDRLAESARPAVDKLATGAHQAVDRIAGVAAGAAEKFGQQGEKLLATRDQLTQSAGTYVRENPLTALGIAVAAGFLLSRLISVR